jgi:hypothetical protein
VAIVVPFVCMLWHGASSDGILKAADYHGVWRWAIPSAESRRRSGGSLARPCNIMQLQKFQKRSLA